MCSSRIKKFNGRHGGHEKGHSLTLSAGENPCLHIQLILQAQTQKPEVFPVEINSLFIGAPAQVEGLSLGVCQRHVFQNRHVGTGSHRRVLVNAANDSLPSVLRHFRNIRSMDENASGIYGNTSADNIQHGSLSGTVASHHGDELPLLHSQAEILKQAHSLTVP